ncbi:hypothetical protein CBL_11630 [Carabus blaptoides fortunei]
MLVHDPPRIGNNGEITTKDTSNIEIMFSSELDLYNDTVPWWLDALSFHFASLSSCSRIPAQCRQHSYGVGAAYRMLYGVVGVPLLELACIPCFVNEPSDTGLLAALGEICARASGGPSQQERF